MTGGSALWVWLAIIGACIGVYYLYRQGKIPWLKGKVIRLPRWFEPRVETQIERLVKATGKEWARAVELRRVLEAKRGLVAARAENIRLVKEIDGVSEKSIEKEKRDEQKAQDAQKVKPRRL